MEPKSLHTKRLILRPWPTEDLIPFAEMNADPKVMEHFPSTLTFEQSESLMKNNREHFQTYGWGPWTAHLVDSDAFIGYIGLKTVPYPTHFTPAIEVGWRLKTAYWGKGYATEGALECLKYGFEILHLKEIVSFTTTTNKKSQAVMVRLGMSYNPKDDFAHPKLPLDHPLSLHVLYRLTSQEWFAKQLQ
jgi:3-dehydroquinate dehydratase/shikimate dehydrogenase